MNQRTMMLLLGQRVFLRRINATLNKAVQEASKGRLHHQACPLGGLFTGMGADASGAPCWCGASDVELEKVPEMLIGATSIDAFVAPPAPRDPARTTLTKDNIEWVFGMAEEMTGCHDPDVIDEERELIREIKKELISKLNVFKSMSKVAALNAKISAMEEKLKEDRPTMDDLKASLMRGAMKCAENGDAAGAARMTNALKRLDRKQGY